MTPTEKPHRYKRMSSALSPYQAAERIADLRATRVNREAIALHEVHKQDADDEAHIRSRVPADLQHRIDVALASLEEAEHDGTEFPKYTGAVSFEEPTLSARLTAPVPDAPRPIESAVKEKGARR